MVAIELRLVEGVSGLTELHALVAQHLDDGPGHGPEELVVGIETDHGPWVQALVAGRYQVYAINPLQVSRYRLRHSLSGAKSDLADAHKLAELVRLDRDHHTALIVDSQVAEQVKVLTRAHQSLIWSRQVNVLRSTLREFYPGALVAFDDLAGRDALAVLPLAPTPDAARRLTRGRVQTALRRARRQRNIESRAAEILTALQAHQLQARPRMADAYGATVGALLGVIGALVEQTQVLRS